ncbi:hypothetical protein FYK55_13315 [Roseiconus nitratireducens]|uniref:Transmembrane protein n=1 Tax=Roseiconus nitratireducens TaxID=2605748 RepID=A0A5M6D9Z8_9BACT|nr:hypothetical protein [Roseiconus nitratireducens]KAA5543250.1 hypothetical protein FYK55_13315 [Roseiconus nitratireducens]
MRIPSQFNDSSLYRVRSDSDQRGRRNPGRRSPGRQMIRLCVALLLVLVVIREASKPGLYESFFVDPNAAWTPIPPGDFAQAADGAAWTTTANETLVVTESLAGGVAQASPSGQAGQADSPAPDQVTRAAWSDAGRWVAAMDLAMQREWMQGLVQLRRGVADGERPIDDDTLERSKQLLIEQAGGDASAAPSERVISDLNAWTSDSLPNWAQISWWSQPTLDALDSAALRRVVDGTFWAGADSDAFYLQLSQVDTLTSDGAVQTGTLPLLQQPDVYRGQRVKVVGRLGMAERQAAKENDFGITEYWTLWIVPEDGGIRPTALVTPQLPDALRTHLDSEGRWIPQQDTGNPEGRLIAVGRFVKRLPYRSSVGADLAPVLIGRVTAVRDEQDNSVSATGSNSQREDESEGTWRSMGLVVAAILGIVIAAGLMYRAKLDQRRTRRLRSQGQLDLDLDHMREDP